MGRAISQFHFGENTLPTAEQILQALRERTGLDIKYQYHDLVCEGFQPVEVEIVPSTNTVEAFYNMVFERFYKKGDNVPYLWIMLKAVLQDMGCTNKFTSELPDWTKKKWADISWFTKRREIYK